ncbi:MAG TPA: glutaredoxin family protein [Spirochaetota bacterium]|nr:glutaredoxin family protein [Spirochaetota bacterium]HOL56403.1 glutaredoxin family protein [Spirochaetota bacterium]HPP03887.1 glutaredoxin family protein [Spirochaetota bacterium]
MNKDVIVYSTPSCPYCIMAKDYFKRNNIPFKDYDVSRDRNKAEEMVRISGQYGVPVIKIGSKVIIGFNQSEIARALAG